MCCWEVRVSRLSSFWKEEYPQGEVVGEYTKLTNPTYHPVTLCHPTPSGSPVIGGEQFPEGGELRYSVSQIVNQ